MNLASPSSIAAVAPEPEVTATEDLMREHGVIGRCLLLCAAAAPRLRSKPKSIDVPALRHTGELFRTFGEDYHEKQLEEAHIFPVIRKMKSVARSAASRNRSESPTSRSSLHRPRPSHKEVVTDARAASANSRP